MASVVDELIVTLGLDPSQFEKGRRQAEDSLKKTKDSAVKHSKDIEASNRSVSDSFEKVATEALSLFSVLLGARGVKEFVSQLNDANAALGRFGTNVGMAPQLVSGWGAAVERMGGSSQNAQGSINAMAKALYDLNTNAKPLPLEIYRLAALSRHPIDFTHGLPTFLNDIAAAAQTLSKTDMTQAHFLLQGAGIDDATANTMIKYGAGMSAYVDSLAKGLAPTKEAIKAAQELNEQFARSQQNVESLGNTVAEKLDPAMSTLLSDFSKWIEDNKALETSTIVDWANKFAAALKEVSADAKEVVDFINQIGAWKGPVLFDIPKAAQEGRDKWERNPDGSIKTVHGPLDDLFNPSKWHWPSFVSSAHAGELPPGFDEGAFESRRGKAFSSFGDSGLTIQGQQISRGNPMPVDIVRIGGSGADANSFLGGPIGCGGPAPAGNAGGGTQGGAPHSIRQRGGAGGHAALSTSQQNEAAIHMIDRLMSHGWTEPAAAIAAGNAMQESGFNPKSSGDPSVPGGSHGLMQWNRERLDALKSFASAQGKDWEDRDIQIDFLDKEARAKIPTWPSQQGLGGAHDISKQFEGYKEGYEGARVGNAFKFYQMHHSHASPAIKHVFPEHPHTLTPSGGARLSSLAATHPVTTSSTSNAIHIGKIDVDARGGDSQEIVNNLHAALERSTSTLLAQSGQV